MRKVAKAAGATTPTLYSRFANKQEILSALVHRIQQNWAELIEGCASPEEAAQGLLDFALAHPHEYELLYADWLGRTAPKGPRANIELMQRKIAEWRGVPVDSCEPLVLALWSMLHGAIMLQITHSVSDETMPKLRAAYHDAIFAIFKNVGK